MVREADVEIIDNFEQFYQDYNRNELGQLAQKYHSSSYPCTRNDEKGRTVYSTSTED